MWGFLAALATGIISYFAASQSTKSNNENIDKSLTAQSNENAKARQYNLQLAEKQNQWNVEQWNRENAYNSPSAQMQRLKEAGLNPDMMMGGGISNTSTSSPQMTSGASASPMDWSSLANKRSAADTALQTLEIAQARANVRKTEAEVENLGNQNDVFDKYGLDMAELSRDKLREELNKLSIEAEKLDLSKSQEQIEHDFRMAYRDKIIENKLQLLETSTGMSKNDLEEDIKTLALRIAGLNAENSRLARMSNFTTEEMRLAFDVIRYIFGSR